jgi:hypothetical protein
MSCTSCNYGLGNTGQGSCLTLASVTKKLIFTEYFTADGSVNGFDITSTPTMNKAYFDALKASLTVTKLYPTPNIAENVSDERADSIFETFDSGKMSFVQTGDRKFTCIFPKASPKLLSTLEGLRCVDLGAYHVDKNSALVGNNSTSTMFAPLRIDNSTIDVKWIPGSDKTAAKIMFSFQYHQAENDSDMAIIPYTPTTTTGLTYDLLLMNGLIDLSGTPTGMSTTGFTVALSYYSGNAIQRGPARGLLAADFKLTNAATGATISITSATESTVTPGTYVFVNAVTVSGQSYRLRQAATHYGYDFSDVADGLVP